MDTNRTLHVYIASPGDVVIERKIVREVCLGLNNSSALKDLGVLLEAEMWEDVFLPDSHAEDIKSRLADSCDIFVCIFYKRFDIRSERLKSRTLNEFFSSYDSWKSMTKPHFMFFFKEVEGNPDLDIRDDQLEKVSAFKERIKSDGLINADSFSAPNEFFEKIYDQIENWAVTHVQAH